MRPMKYDKLSDRDKYDLDRFAHESRMEQIRVSHSRRYAGPPNDISYPMGKDEYLAAPNLNILDGDVMSVQIPLDQLMRLLTVDDRLRTYELNRDEIDRQKEQVRKHYADLRYEEHLRKKHTPLQKVWEKYLFTKDMVTDPNKKPNE